jgi:outer membrane protein, multidrug efflux system
VTLPLFQGGQLNADLRRTKAVYEETVAKYRQTVLTAFAEVENNLAAEHLLTDEYQKVLDALKSGRRQQEIAGNRYASGLATYLEVATAQNATLGIERTGVRLRGQQLVSVAALIKSIGGGWNVTDTGNKEP